MGYFSESRLIHRIPIESQTKQHNPTILFNPLCKDNEGSPDCVRTGDRIFAVFNVNPRELHSKWQESSRILERIPLGIPIKSRRNPRRTSVGSYPPPIFTQSSPNPDPILIQIQ